ncbi:plasmid partitioning/stability family protein [Pantoea sp.]|uniref:plasmid partitioning/stability family protein n=1 Tax=Pantoea sp. TaxID=69393 RepID=UPI0028A080F4|nr:plasmid partitioning/stability family protein [Pantoea sp.]
MDTRRKILFYINPSSSQADGYVNARLDSVPQGERGKLQRVAMVSGFALQKIDPRIPFLLTELLTENTSAEEILQILKAVLQRDIIATEPVSSVTAEKSVSKNAVESTPPATSDDEDITRKNSRNLF